VDYDLLPVLTLTAGFRYETMIGKTRSAGNSFYNATFVASQTKLNIAYKPARKPDLLPDRQQAVTVRALQCQPVSPTYKSEFVRNFRGRLQDQPARGQGVVNGALFYRARSQLSILFVDVRTASQIDQNIDRVDVKGAELENTMAPGHRGRCSPTLDTATQKSAARCLSQYVGNYTPNLTPWNAAVGTEYRAHARQRPKMVRTDRRTTVRA